MTNLRVLMAITINFHDCGDRFRCWREGWPEDRFEELTPDEFQLLKLWAIERNYVLVEHTYG